MTMAAHPARYDRATPAAAARGVMLWLFGCCLMIYAMVVIGGITRLTESGLSIVKWEPISGTLPPLGPAGWDAAFAAYRTSPQFALVNHGMDLAAFKTIFWWEYLHRLWGRLIGLAFFVPFVWFLRAGTLSRRMVAPLAAIFALGAMQGAIGWWMVASGLQDLPSVSPYRLTIHLATALALYSAILWVALGLLPQRTQQSDAVPALRVVVWLLVGIASLTIIAGGFVAGLRAGMIYNSFPLMGGNWLPADYADGRLGWLRNAFENPVAAQWHHRLLGTLCFVVAWTGALIGLATCRDRVLVWLMAGAAAMVTLQAGLGIATLLWVRPVPLAALHQAGAVAVLTLALCATRRLYASTGWATGSIADSPAARGTAASGATGSTASNRL